MESPRLCASHRGGPGESSWADAIVPVSPVITLEGVSKHFQSNGALHNVSATIPPGQFVAIIGRSGAGKTTLLHCLSRTTTVTAGEHTLGTCVTSTSLHGEMLRQHRDRVGMIYQQFNLVKRLHVCHNVLVGRLPHLVAWPGGWLSGAISRGSARHCPALSGACRLAASRLATHRYALWRRAAACRHCQGTGSAAAGHPGLCHGRWARTLRRRNAGPRSAYRWRTRQTAE